MEVQKAVSFLGYMIPPSYSTASIGPNSGQKIAYVYDASGTKLRQVQIAVNGTVTKTILRTILFILIVLIFSCTSTKYPMVHKKEIIGRWCLEKELTGYSTITFTENSLVVLSTNIDTIYFYRYYLEGKYLYFQNFEDKKAKTAILKFTKNSLVLAPFLDTKETQVYYKCE